jgi:hypothetical protein
MFESLKKIWQKNKKNKYFPECLALALGEGDLFPECLVPGTRGRDLFPECLLPGTREGWEPFFIFLFFCPIFLRPSHII